MKICLLVAVLALPGGVLAAAPLLPAGPYIHVSAPARVPGQRWKPDVALHEGMRRVHVAVEELHRYELGHMSVPMALDRASAVEAAVSYMFTHCRLAAAPDAALHGILVPLLAAAQALKGDPERLKAVADMRTAIAPYPQYFDDPGWDLSAPAMHEMHDEP